MSTEKLAEELRELNNTCCTQRRAKMQMENIMTDYDYEKIMQQWDSWVKYYRTTDSVGSWPRDSFESLIACFMEDIQELKKCCTQRGARMQIMREWLINQAAFSTHDWQVFCDSWPDAKDWFDEDGTVR